MDLVLTVDTEADNQWDHGVPVATRNVAFWPPFMDLCVRHGVRPTYFVTCDMLEDDSARSMLATWSHEGLAEIGAHLHPWTTPPFAAASGLTRNDAAHAFPSDLPEALLRAKLVTLSEQLTDCVGVRPTSFRAGRFGMSTTCAKLLVELGYVVDSSVTPFISWRDSQGLPGGSGGPDFRRHLPSPFLVEGVGDGRLLEVPLTIMPTSPWATRNEWATSAYLSRPFRAWRRLSGHRCALPGPPWMRPGPGTKCRDLERLWGTAERQGLDIVVMMLHSSELMPGGSPYRPTRRSVAALLVLLDEFFTFARANGSSFPTLTTAAHTALAGPVPSLPL